MIDHKRQYPMVNSYKTKYSIIFSDYIYTIDHKMRRYGLFKIVLDVDNIFIMSIVLEI